MASSHILVGASETAADPTVRSIAPADLVDALKKGWDDFSAMPSHAVFLCVIYPAIGILVAALTLGYAFVPWLFPAAAGTTTARRHSPASGQPPECRSPDRSRKETQHGSASH